MVKNNKKEWGEEGIETQFVVITKIKSVTFKEEKKDKKGYVVSNTYAIEAEDQRMKTWEESRKEKPKWADDKDDNNKEIEKKIEDQKYKYDDIPLIIEDYINGVSIFLMRKHALYMIRKGMD